MSLCSRQLSIFVPFPSTGGDVQSNYLRYRRGVTVTQNKMEFLIRHPALLHSTLLQLTSTCIKPSAANTQSSPADSQVVSTILGLPRTPLTPPLTLTHCYPINHATQDSSDLCPSALTPLEVLRAVSPPSSYPSCCVRRARSGIPYLGKASESGMIGEERGRHAA